MARELDILAQLQHIKKGTSSLSIYLPDFRSICDQLDAIGTPVSDTNKVFRLLKGLDDSNEAFQYIMLMPPIASYARVVLHLQSYELSCRCIVTIPSYSIALAAQQRPGRGRGNFGGCERGSFNSKGRGFSQTTHHS